MNYADIKTIDIQDGTGVRVSIYVSGCHFHCEGCHNKEAWDFNYGKPYTEETEEYILKLLDRDYIAGLSILGGEPMELVNQEELANLVEKVKEKFPSKDIWCYTGYDFEKDIMGDMYNKYDFTKRFLKNIDIMVDGQFIQEKNMVDLKFRGSYNQRKVDVQESMKNGSIVTLKFGDEDRYEGKEEQKPKVISVVEFNNENKNDVEMIYDNGINSMNENKMEDQVQMPYFDEQDVKERIAAKNIGNKDKNKV